MKNIINRKAIGVLGGIGPQASLYLCKLLIEKSVKFFNVENNEDFPEIILDSIPVPGFIADTNEKEIAYIILKERITNLQRCNILFFIIACNTAHVLLDKLQQATKTPFLSIILEVVKQVKKDKIKKVGLLASPSTIKYGLYQEALEKEGIAVVIPSKSEQVFFENIVVNVLKGKSTRQDTKQLSSVADSLKAKGAEGIILGCTELPLVFPKKYALPVYNSVEILAEASLQKYYSYNR